MNEGNARHLGKITVGLLSRFIAGIARLFYTPPRSFLLIQFVKEPSCVSI